MPEIPLLHQGKPFGPFKTKIILDAIMLSPRDLDSLVSYLVLVFQSPTYSRVVKDVDAKFIKAAPGGAIAGQVFYNLLQLKLHQHLLPLKRHRPQEASVSKAVFLVSRGLKNQPLRGGRTLPRDPDRVHNFWVKFLPAAHLWAAWLLVDDAGRIPDLQNRPDPQNLSEDTIGIQNQRLLLLADALLSAATAEGLKFEQEPWTLPDAYPGKPFSIIGLLPPPTPWAIEQLKDYQVPARPK
jgi:hypothetical protein